jgi:Arc/MetJ-type ribon-helix-helix transcriptional regulator
MNVNIGEYYEAKLMRLISKGVATNKTEALRMAINAYEKQIEEQEEKMVIDRIEHEYEKMDKTKFVSFDKVLKESKIDRKKL